MASGHLVAHRQFAFHGDINLHQLDYAGGEFVALLELGDLFVDNLAQNVDLARGHLFDLINLLVYARILVFILNALQVTRGNTLDGFAVENRALGEQALVRTLVVQVGLHFLTAKNIVETLEALIGENSDLIGEIFLELLDLGGFDRLRALVLLLSLAREDFHVDNRTFDSRRASERRIPNVSRLLAEDRSQQFLLRCELRFALGSNFAHKNVASMHRCPNADHAALVKITQRRFGNVGNIARDFFRSELCVARLDLEFLDMHRGVVVLAH